MIEFRHESWWTDKVYKRLARHNISFCGISHPTLPNDIIVNNPLVYYRFHGTPELYKTPYNKRFLKKVATTIGGSLKSKQVFLFFNNDIDVNAPKNAKEMQQIISSL